MPAVYLSSFGGVGAQFFDANGDPLTGGKIYSYAAGTTTPLATYTTDAGDVPHTNPIILDSAGRVPSGQIWQAVGVLYKFVLATSTNVLIATYDNVPTIVSGSSSVANFTGNGSTIAFTLPAAPTSLNATNVYINGVYQMKNTYTLSSSTVSFSEAPPTTALIEILYL